METEAIEGRKGTLETTVKAIAQCFDLDEAALTDTITQSADKNYIRYVPEGWTSKKYLVTESQKEAFDALEEKVNGSEKKKETKRQRQYRQIIKIPHYANGKISHDVCGILCNFAIYLLSFHERIHRNSDNGRLFRSAVTYFPPHIAKQRQQRLFPWQQTKPLVARGVRNDRHIHFRSFGSKCAGNGKGRQHVLSSNVSRLCARLSFGSLCSAAGLL